MLLLLLCKGASVAAHQVAQKNQPRRPILRQLLGARKIPGSLKGPRDPLKGPRGPFKGPRGPLKGPRGPFKGPPGPLKRPRGPLKGPRDPLKGPRDPLKGPRGPLKGPRGPFKGPRGPLKGPRGPLKGPRVGRVKIKIFGPVLLCFSPEIDPGTPLDRPAAPRTSICTKSQPRRPILRPFRGGPGGVGRG